MSSIIAFLVLSFSAFAEDKRPVYLKIAECMGHTDQHDVARAVIFADQKATTLGYVVVSLESGWDYLSFTKIDWRATPQGYPRVYENDFALDVLINDKQSTWGSLQFAKLNVRRLECNYAPPPN